MSLFKAREWWSTACGTDETFDIGCMLVASIGSEKQQDQRIVVGSHEVSTVQKKKQWLVRVCFCRGEIADCCNDCFPDKNVIELAFLCICIGKLTQNIVTQRRSHKYYV